MMTREEQIVILEETLERLITKVAADVTNGGGYDSQRNRAIELQAVVETLMYLRSIPNPRGVVPHPRRRSLRLEDV